MSRVRIHNKEYDSLFARKTTFYSKHYVFYIKDFDSLVCKVTVKKKVGNAVVRNFLKRRLRAILSGLNFNKSYLVLGVVLRRHEMDFIREKLYVEKVLQPLIG